MTLCTDKLVQALLSTDGLKQDVISGITTIGELATKAWGAELKQVCYKEMPVHEIYDFVSSFTGTAADVPAVTGAAVTETSKTVF